MEKIKRLNPEIVLIRGENIRGYLREAYQYAWDKSDDHLIKVGAVITNQTLTEILSYGTNRFEGKKPSKRKMQDRDWIIENITHAEVDVIKNAKRAKERVRGAVMFAPWASCTPCAQYMVDSGIRIVISHKEQMEKTPEEWYESIINGLNLIRKANIKHYAYDGKIGGVKAMFNGSVWKP
ncbi:deaminase [Nanoarchaeota archaeon]